MGFYYIARWLVTVLIGYSGAWVENEEVVVVPTYLNKSASINIAINL